MAKDDLEGGRAYFKAHVIPAFLSERKRENTISLRYGVELLTTTSRCSVQCLMCCMVVPKRTLMGLVQNTKRVLEHRSHPKFLRI
jgi:hypothetical protein